MGYVVVCEKGLVALEEYATPEQAERIRDAVAADPACAWRRDQMSIRPATLEDRRNFKHIAGYTVLPKTH